MKADVMIIVHGGIVMRKIVHGGIVMRIVYGGIVMKIVHGGILFEDEVKGKTSNISKGDGIIVLVNLHNMYTEQNRIEKQGGFDNDTEPTTRPCRQDDVIIIGRSYLMGI